MKISCDIIQDVLPLYAEDMVRPATKEMVEGHLRECEGCKAELEVLRKPQKLPVEVEVKSLKRVGESIRRRRILAVLAVFLFITTVLVGGALMLDATVYLTANEAVEEIFVTEDGVTIRWDDRIIGTSGFVDKENPQNYEVTAWTNVYNYWFYKGRVSYDELDAEVKALISKEQYEMMDNTSTYTLEKPNETNFIYVCPREHSMTLILNANQPLPDGPQMEVQLDTLYYFIGLVVFSILCFAAGMYFRETWYGELITRMAIVSTGLAISTVIVTAGQFYTLAGGFQEAVIDSTAVALPMGLFGLCTRQLIKLNRQDKGL